MTETDLIIIGAGPAGLQAAIHASRRKISVLVVGKASNSAMNGTEIENYLGLSGVTDGAEFLMVGRAQAESFGCSFLEENIISAQRDGDTFRFVTENDNVIDARSVIIATGISRKKLNVPGEKEFFGKGVSYCASCDCNFYKGKIATIVGDETEAAVSAELMTRYASKVYWVSKNVKASGYIKDKAIAAGAELIEDEISQIEGPDRVHAVLLKSGRRIETNGVFIELGAKSAADIAMDIDVMPEMDDTIKVDSRCATEVEGVFACGDVAGKPWQVAKAVGQGAVAGTYAADYVKGLR